MNAPKVDPESIALRAPPRPVTRLNRRALTIVVAVLAAAVLGATLWSLQSRPGLQREAAPELHNVERVERAEGLAQLPPDYSKVRPPTANPTVPVLGPPLPGDLGSAILQAERRAGTGADIAATPTASLGADPVEDAKRVERLNRQREADEAAKAPLFFRGTSQRDQIAKEPASAKTPGDAAPAIDAMTLRRCVKIT